jgi:fatty-acyl-CoA synthase
MSLTRVTAIGDLLLAAADRWPDRPAVVFPEATETYAEVAAGARAMACGLQALGIPQGAHVGILMPNCHDMVHAIFGIALAGCVVCPLNARYRSAELAYLVEATDLAALLTSDIVDEHVDYAALLHEALPGLAEADADAPRLELPTAPLLRHVVLLGQRGAAGMLDRDAYEALAASVPDALIEERRAAVRVRDPGLILTTSGTTANPKGCVITHEAIVRGSRAVGEREQIDEDDVVWDGLPLFHTSGLQPLLYTLDRGSRFLTMTHFEPGEALAQIREHGATVVKSTFPPITMAIVNHPDFATIDVDRVRIVQLVAPPDTLQLVMRAFPAAAIQGAYGLCEAGGYVAVNALGEDPERRLTSEGPPFPGIEVRARRDDGTWCAVDEPGELLVRGYTLFERYHRDPERTAEVVDAAGWLHTGDRGSIGPDGGVRFLGRIKEMIRVGGENVGPAEVEGFLSTHPAVHLVQAVGVPDARLDEVVAAFVELKPGHSASEQELIDFCVGKIASYRVPRHVRIVSEWPMSATKIQRFRLREEFLSEFSRIELSDLDSLDRTT